MKLKSKVKRTVTPSIKKYLMKKYKSSSSEYKDIDRF
jgi:hypothetical protein